MIYRVIKVKIATDEQVAVIGEFHVEEHAYKVSEMFNDENSDDAFFYTVDEIYSDEDEAQIDAAWAEYRAMESEIERKYELNALRTMEDYETLIGE